MDSTLERIASVLALVAVTHVTAQAAQPATKNSSQKLNQIYRLDRQGDNQAVAAFKAYLKDDALPVRYLAALALAKRGDASGVSVLKNVLDTKPGDRKLPTLHGFTHTDDPRYEAAAALAKLEPDRAFAYHVDYLESARGIHQKLYGRQWSGGFVAFSVDLAAADLHKLARKAGKAEEVIGRFRARCDKDPQDSDAYYILARLHVANGKKESARRVRLEEIEKTATCPEEAALRRSYFIKYRELDKRIAAYRKFLAFDGKQLDKLRAIDKKKPFLGTWALQSPAEFRRHINSQLADCLWRKGEREEAKTIYTELFRAHPFPSYAEALYNIIDEEHRRAKRPLDHPARVQAFRQLIRLLVAGVAKAPNDENLKLVYAKALLNVGRNAEASRILQAALRSRWHQTRNRAVRLLGEFHGYAARKTAKDAVPALVPCLKDKNHAVRAHACEALGNMGADAVAAVPALCEMLKGLTETDGALHLQATRALYKMGRAAKDATPVLVQQLKHKNADMRRHAARALGKIAPPGSDAVPPLIRALKDRELYVRIDAARALGEVGDKRAVPALAAALNDREGWVRHHAAEALGEIGPAAGAAAPALRELSNDEYDFVRHAATRALKQVSGQPK